MSIRQISVFLENRPGKLSELTRLLAANRIDIRALSLAETTDFGIARLIVDDAARASEVLGAGGFVSNETRVLAFAVPDEPGGLDRLLDEFNAAHVNIEYMYAFYGSGDRGACMIFRVTDTEASEAALSARGLTPLAQEAGGAVLV